MPKDSNNVVVDEMQVSNNRGWEAKTVYHLGGQRYLTISTYKGNTGVATTASVFMHRPDGCTVHAICGDFSERVASSARKATQNAVVVQHREVEKTKDAILNRAAAFYAMKDYDDACEEDRTRDRAAFNQLVPGYVRVPLESRV